MIYGVIESKEVGGRRCNDSSAEHDRDAGRQDRL